VSAGGAVSPAYALLRVSKSRANGPGLAGQSSARVSAVMT